MLALFAFESATGSRALGASFGTNARTSSVNNNNNKTTTTTTTI